MRLKYVRKHTYNSSSKRFTTPDKSKNQSTSLKRVFLKVCHICFLKVFLTIFLKVSPKQYQHKHMFGTVVRKKDGVSQVNGLALLGAELDFKTKFHLQKRQLKLVTLVFLL